MRLLAVITIILGLAVLVFGILFLPKASSAEQEVAESIAPNLTTDALDVTYDNIDNQLRSLQGNEPQYLQLFAQRTSLGLARSNMGVASLARTLGIMNIIAGLGLIVVGCGLMRKNSA